MAESNRTWILVAHRGGAKVLESDGLVKNLRLLHDLPHPEGRLQDREINTDKSGGSRDSMGTGKLSTTDPHEFATEHIASQFAKKLCEMLHKGRAENTYDKLILVAEARFLGYLRKNLDAQTTARVTHTFDKNLAELPNKEMHDRLHNLLNA